MDTNEHGWIRGDGCWIGKQDEHRCRSAASMLPAGRVIEQSISGWARIIFDWATRLGDGSRHSPSAVRQMPIPNRESLSGLCFTVGKTGSAEEHDLDDVMRFGPSLQPTEVENLAGEQQLCRGGVLARVAGW